MNRHAANQLAHHRYASLSWGAADLVFAVLGPLALSALFASWFGRDKGPDVSPYPWPYPAWAFGVTLLKTAAMAVWLCLRDRRAGHSPALRGFLAGVFLVGGLHAMACGAFNARYASQEFPVPLLVAMAFLSGLFYFRNLGRACRHAGDEPALAPIDLLVGVVVTVTVPAMAEILLFGKPWL